MRLNQTHRVLAVACAALVLIATFALCGTSYADGGVTYTDVAGASNGLSWNRAPSPNRIAVRDAAVAQSPIPLNQFFRIRAEETPQKPTGSPGVAIFDYDDDGDLDVYVSNGPGAANSLFQNQLANGGGFNFVDVGVAAGVGADWQDSTGVCAGDVDNDGDQDLYVVATAMPNVLFENNGDGTFSDVTNAAGAAGQSRHAIACTMADFDNDGLLDIVIGNTYDDWTHRQTVFTPGALFNPGPHYEGMEHNTLLMNQGGNTFTDMSAASGIEVVSNMAGPGLTGAAFTWAISSADYDLDGDVDILSADNQGAPPGNAAEERGWLRLYENDGNANFADVTIARGLDVWGGWMGLDFADFNCDGHMDFFATNLGGYIGGPPVPSQWFFGSASGTFTNPGQGAIITNPFGWGTSMIDYDNDGDSDIMWHGGVDIFSLFAADNPGVILTNTGDCSGVFSWDQGAVLKDHRTRSVNGVAAGDLNGDGFEDIVSVSNFDFIPVNPRPFVGVLVPPSGSPFDAVANFENVMSTAPNPGFATYLNPIQTPGTMSVELNSADNGNNSVQIELVGGVGAVTGAGVNRDGIGAVVFFTPDGGNTSMRPITGGASYGSQDALPANFGTGSASGGVAEVLWPGGVRNRLYGVQAGEKLTFPEIPCSFDGNWGNQGQYVSCVANALNEAGQAGLIDASAKARFLVSAKQAFDDAQ